MKLYTTINKISDEDNRIVSKSYEINILPMLRYLDQGFEKIIQFRWIIFGFNIKMK